MPFKAPQAPKCPKCGKSVYQAEERLAAGRSFHNTCFKCSMCNKMLDSTTVAEREDSLFCKTCYGKKFGPKGVGFGQGAGALGMDSGERFGNKPTESTAPMTGAAYLNVGKSSEPAKPSKYGSTAEKCPRCGGSVYPAEKVIGAGKSWHKVCFKCSACNKALDSTNVCDREGEIYCKACYARGFGPSGLRAGQGAGVRTETKAPSTSVF
ncbi:PREDICTED: cysteine and glycine-rich protein 2-like isoform X2 [Branchiostoma belcheri]|uniref:Cysteine and glycine-rich protein 2-like isoform X2 n=1 Tax=Branchiostoma belcheri TaxID=7741 RepID=A0A6P4ZSN4_BRABE|nr:PREDICTED: cysteine and glycine-rich protein 2-like isoform X2 [Branchiostoma belcheri]